MIKDPSLIFYRLGTSYSHLRGDWAFNASCRLDNFKFGADWYIYKWHIQDLSLYFGFFELNWLRLYPVKKKDKKCKKHTKKTGK